MLLIVWYSLADGTHPGEGFSIRNHPKYNNQGKTVGLLLHVLEPIFAKGNVVILDSGFCVLKGIVEVEKCGVYASTLIKKQKYWPEYIKGDAIRDHFNNKNVGDCDSLEGNMEEVPFHVYAMKEPDYVMSLMSMYGTNQHSGKETTHEWWMGVEMAKKPKLIILRWLETTSCTDTLSMTTTINNTHLLV